MDEYLRFSMSHALLSPFSPISNPLSQSSNLKPSVHIVFEPILGKRQFEPIPPNQDFQVKELSGFSWAQTSQQVHG